MFLQLQRVRISKAENDKYFLLHHHDCIIIIWPQGQYLSSCLIFNSENLRVANVSVGPYLLWQNVFYCSDWHKTQFHKKGPYFTLMQKSNNCLKYGNGPLNLLSFSNNSQWGSSRLAKVITKVLSLFFLSFLIHFRTIRLTICVTQIRWPPRSSYGRKMLLPSYSFAFSDLKNIGK